DIDEMRRLPFRDPFDRMIVGTAKRLRLPIITKDTEITDSALVEPFGNGGEQDLGLRQIGIGIRPGFSKFLSDGLRLGSLVLARQGFGEAPQCAAAAGFAFEK